MLKFTKKRFLQQATNKMISMASFQLSIVFAVLAIFVPLSLAKDYVVGDKEGWTVGQDYEAWTKGKKFAVGDKLVFKYKKGSHNVIEVRESEFKECKALDIKNELNSGEDEVKLDAPGKRYFICNVGKHCGTGKQKIAIDVQSSSSAGPASSPDASSPTESAGAPSTSTVSPGPGPASKSAATTGGRYGWMVVISGIIGYLMV